MRTDDADQPEDGGFVAVDPALLEDDNEDHVKISEYGRVIIPDKKELMRQTQGLDPEQRLVVDKAIEYAKKIKRAMAPCSGDWRLPVPHARAPIARREGSIKGPERRSSHPDRLPTSQRVRRWVRCRRLCQHRK